MNRRIAMSAFSILSALALLGGGAFAAFTTTATATTNTFSTTTPSLLLSVNGNPEGTSVAGVNVSGLVPGTPAATQNFSIHNADADTDATMGVFMQLSPTGANTLPGADLTIVVNCGSGDISDTYAGWITGHDLGLLTPTQTKACTLIATLNSGVGNSDINKAAVFDAVFTGTVGN